MLESEIQILNFEPSTWGRALPSSSGGQMGIVGVSLWVSLRNKTQPRNHDIVAERLLDSRLRVSLLGGGGGPIVFRGFRHERGILSPPQETSCNVITVVAHMWVIATPLIGYEVS